jgi:diacylglycerol kinase (ATP)
MRTVLFINTHSRQARKLSNEVIHALSAKKSGFDIVDVIIVKSLEDLDSDLKKLKFIDKLECVIVGSGDGTIVAILNALKGRKKITYGFLPLGTSNTFVRSLGLPPKAADAIDIISKKRTRLVSLGAVNGVLFANIAGVGLPVRVVRNLTDRMKKYLGPFAYLVSGAKELIGHSAIQCTIIEGRKRESFYTHHLLIANGKYHGHLPIAADASLFKNQLVVVAFGVSQSRWHYIKSMVRFGLGTHESDPHVRLIPIKKARLLTSPNRRIEADGEMISSTPAEIKIIKNAIRVFTV